MTKYELKNWLENKHVVGAFYKNNIVENTHDYKKNVAYLHFFKNLEDASSVLSILSPEADILCKFSYDKYLLKNFEGKGTYFYNGLKENGLVKAIEYAIPSKLISKDNLVEYMEVKNTDQAKYLSESVGWTKIEKEVELTK